MRIAHLNELIKNDRNGQRNMNIFELEEQMENSFHDSCLTNISVDYLSMTLSLEFEIVVGLSDNEYEKKTVVIEGLQQLFIEPSETTIEEKPWITDFGNYFELTEKPIKSDNLRESRDIFVCYFFVSNWNSFIVIAGKDCYLKE